MIDIIMPESNQSQMLEMADRLGYKKLIAINGEESDPVSCASPKPGKGLSIVRAGKNNRAYFEDKRVDCIFGLEMHNGKDFIHHRNSGLNQVLCKLASKNSIAIGFAFSPLLGLEPRMKSAVLGRMKQNAAFCRKYGLPFVLASFASRPYQMRSPIDMISFGSVLGFHPSDSRKAISGGIVNFK